MSLSEVHPVRLSPRENTGFKVRERWGLTRDVPLKYFKWNISFMTVFFEILHWSKKTVKYFKYRKKYFMPFQTYVLGVVSNPSLFCAIFSTCFGVTTVICLSTGPNPNPNHNRMVLGRVRKEWRKWCSILVPHNYMYSICAVAPWGRKKQVEHNDIAFWSI